MKDLEGYKVRGVYPVYFTKTDTIVLVEVPDLEILTEGKDMKDANVSRVLQEALMNVLNVRKAP